MKVRYAPFDVPVSDERGFVRGAAIHLPDGRQFFVIPPEGPSPDAWMGSAYYESPVDRSDDIRFAQWLNVCEKSAISGADGETGEIEIDDVADVSIATVDAAMRAFNREAAPGSECQEWQDYVADCDRRYGAPPWKLIERRVVVDPDFISYWMTIAVGGGRSATLTDRIEALAREHALASLDVGERTTAEPLPADWEAVGDALDVAAIDDPSLDKQGYLNIYAAEYARTIDDQR